MFEPLSIDTAPKDGTMVMIFATFGGWSIRYWGEGEDGDDDWQPRIRGAFPMTHWQPLPPAPGEIK